jgi:uncharacterized protein (DUF433 family)
LQYGRGKPKFSTFGRIKIRVYCTLPLNFNNARLQKQRYNQTMADPELLHRITSDPEIFAGKPIVRGRRLAVEHILAMLAAGDSAADILAAYSFLEPDDIRACILYAYKLVAHERIDPFPIGSAV